VFEEIAEDGARLVRNMLALLSALGVTCNCLLVLGMAILPYVLFLLLAGYGARWDGGAVLLTLSKELMSTPSGWSHKTDFGHTPGIRHDISQ